MRSLKEALDACQPGCFVKTRKCGWSEYWVQYGRDAQGNLFWTGGLCVGGPLDDSRILSAPIGDYRVYKVFGRDDSMVE